MAQTALKNLEYYLSIHYPYSVVEDDGSYFISFPDLPGCITQVEDASEIHTAAQEIKELWLETALENGQRIPEPVGEEFSGKLLARLPKTLHRDLAYQARAEGMSLNAYIVYLLAERNAQTTIH